MSHFFWLPATCFQESVSKCCRAQPMVFTQDTWAGRWGWGCTQTCEPRSAIVTPPRSLMPPLCHTSAIVAARLTCQAKLGHVLAAGFLSCKQMLARACCAMPTAWPQLAVESLLHGEPVWGVGLKGSALPERRGKGNPEGCVPVLPDCCSLVCPITRTNYQSFQKV